MEQLHDETKSTSIPDKWDELQPAEFVKILLESKLKDVIEFARSSSKAAEFIKSHRDEITDLNPYSVLVQDHFPCDADNIYEFSILVRLGHKTSNGTDEERILARTSNDLREILTLLRPDVLDIKLTYFSSFKDDIEKILGRPLAEGELLQLEWKSLHLQIDRQRTKLANYLASNGFSESDFSAAKEDVLHQGNPQNMGIDVYDTAYAIERGFEQLTLKLNLMEAGSKSLQDDLEHCRFNCVRNADENDLC